MNNSPLARGLMGQGLAAVPSRMWPDLIDEARWEGLTGLLHVVSHLQGVVLPGAEGAVAAAEHLDLARANLASLGSLSEVIGEASQAGVDVLVLPGAGLLDLYPDLGCRPMDDVDVLVRPGDAPALTEVLLRLGFRQPRDHLELFVRDGCTMDVHTDLVNASRVRARHLASPMDVEGVWGRCRTWKLSGEQEALAASREDELLYTAAHALRHSYRRLSWFCDFHLLVSQSLDWDLVADLARKGNLERPLAYGLRFLEQEAQVPLPAVVPSAWRTPALGWVEERLLTRLLRARPHVELGEVLWSCSCPNWVARLRFLGEFLFPRPQVLRQVFPGVPRVLMPLTYLLRMGQVCRRGGAALVGMAKG